MPLAQLIMDETDRVRRLVDRMEAFSDDAPPARASVNIHQVLDRVRALAANGVADGLALKESYDPSLPPVWGEEDQLIQIFLNLVKNAAEAAHSRRDGRGEVLITTAYRHGVRVRAGDGKAAQGAPLEVRVQDNGPGVPPHLRDHLFEPFVTSKANGVGPRPGAGRQAGGRARRPDRLRIRARPHRVPRPPARRRPRRAPTWCSR